MLFPAAAAAALLTASLFWLTTAPDTEVAPPAPPVAAVEPAPVIEDEPVDVLLPDEIVVADASEELRQKWQLSGIARVGESSVMILSGRKDNTVRRIGAKDDLDGWTVADAGANYAVFSQEGEEVRLVLNDETSR